MIKNILNWRTNMDTKLQQVETKTSFEDLDISVLDFKEVDIAYTAHEPGRC